jgi:hypothetical protein
MLHPSSIFKLETEQYSTVGRSVESGNIMLWSEGSLEALQAFPARTQQVEDSTMGTLEETFPMHHPSGSLNLIVFIVLRSLEAKFYHGGEYRVLGSYGSFSCKWRALQGVPQQGPFPMHHPSSVLKLVTEQYSTVGRRLDSGNIMLWSVGSLEAFQAFLARTHRVEGSTMGTLEGTKPNAPPIKHVETFHRAVFHSWEKFGECKRHVVECRVLGSFALEALENLVQ